MESAQKRPALGRGLDALFGDGQPAAAPVAAAVDQVVEQQTKTESGVQMIAVDLIEANPEQPRRTFAESDLKELAASIKEQGVIQPIVVRRSPKQPEMYEIVAGERRWRAAQLAEHHQVPVIVRELDDKQAMAIAIIENVQRADLNAIEEAEGYQALIDRFAYTQEQLAEVVGKSRPHITNTIRLTGLPGTVKEYLREGKISAGHARALLTAKKPEALAKKVVSRGMSVRQTEQAVKQDNEPPAARKSATAKPADTAVLEGELSVLLQTDVSINDRGEKGGEVVIAYRSAEDLERIERLLKRVGDEVVARA